jgi:hypothetical protein
MKEDKPTVFITASRAIIVRNYFLNIFFNKLSEHYNVVIITSLFDDPEFKEKFRNFKIYELKKRNLGPFKDRLEKFLMIIYKGLIYNPTVEVRTRYGLLKRGDVRFKRMRYFVQKYIFGKIFGHKFVRECLRYIDSKIFNPDLYNDLIKKYNPKALISTSISDLDEVVLMRNFKKKGIKIIGMQKSWDNASKFGFREKADVFLAWSEYVKEEVIKYQDYLESSVSITGIPQFDYYKTLKTYSKEEFFKKYKLNPEKKLIVFGSEGPVTKSDPYIVSLINNGIESGKLDGYQILVRPHFSYKGDEKRFFQLEGEHVKIDSDYKRSNSKDGIELSMNTIKNLMAQIRYSDVFITSASTLVLDAIANGKYPILYAFDEKVDTPFKDSTKRLYGTLWFREINKMNLDNFVNNQEELFQKIKEVETHPDLKLKERENIIRRFCYRLDGKSGLRIFEEVNRAICNT